MRKPLSRIAVLVMGSLSGTLAGLPAQQPAAPPPPDPSAAVQPRAATSASSNQAPAREKARPDFVPRRRGALFQLKPVNLVQLTQLLGGLTAQRDRDAARALAAVELTERMEAGEAAAAAATLPGKQSRMQLRAMADASVFLRPSRTAMPALPEPPVDEQKRLLARGAAFLAAQWSALPDFDATQTSIRYSDAYSDPDEDELYLGTPWQNDAHAQSVLTFRAHSEVVKPTPRHPHEAETGLLLTGAFGTLAGTLFTDAQGDRVQWSRWEQDANGLLAVFAYRVPAPLSHSALVYVDLSSGRADTRLLLSGYHGTLALDPATGAVRRIVLEADLDAKAPVERADIAVEFGPVSLADHVFVLPVHGVTATALVVEPEDQRSTPGDSLPRITILRDVTFGPYRLVEKEGRK